MRLLDWTLQTRRGGKWGRERKCQGALTLGEMMRGGVLEQGEGLVRLKTLRNVLCALITDAVAVETASES